jgi:hypothetical protein
MCRFLSLSYDALNETQGRGGPHFETGSGLYLTGWERLRLDPLTTGSLREDLNMTGRPERNRFERALQELQVTLNIARRNSLEDENDTWILFSDQYLDVVRVGNDLASKIRTRRA